MDKLWYNKPARLWREALPIGNGITGVMIFGGKKTEKLCFNDCTLWSGYPKDHTNPESLKYLKEVRKLIFEGRTKEADKLCMEKLCGEYSEGYLPLGDLTLSLGGCRFNGYRRELDLGTAVHTVSFEGTKRESFCSYPDKIAVYKITSSQPISLTVTAKSKLHSEVVCDNGLNLIGNAPDYVAPSYLKTERHPVHYEEGKGMSFCLRCEAASDGRVICNNGKITVSTAKEITLYMTTATGFCGFDRMPETDRSLPLEKCKSILTQAGKNYADIKKKHIDDYSAIYTKSSVSLCEDTDLSTGELMNLAKKGEVKTALVELFYNFGKYMTVAGSRKGGQALNLQGIWNKSVRPPWSSNYTTNINTQMNYWGASVSNLTECIEPYINLVYGIMQNGKRTAQVNYGCSGFCCNHNADIWCKTAPVKGDPCYMFEPLCGAWLVNEIYGHYKNGGLFSYRDKIYEMVTESAKFINDYIVLHDGYYVTAPSASPENSFRNQDDVASLDYASAFEMSIVRQAFANYLEILEEDSLSLQVKDKLSKLYPLNKGSQGMLEWHKDYETPESGHRHFSPLYGFYPARTIKYYANPKETEWVRELYEYRNKNAKQYIGWSAAWAICLAGRLHDGEKALSVIKSMLSHSVFSNLFCVHPPFLFQIDGNMGFIGGINEMLLYCEDNIVELLPALPAQWQSGKAEGLLVCGAEISFEWKDGEIINVRSSMPIKLSEKQLAPNAALSENIEIQKRR